MSAAMGGQRSAIEEGTQLGAYQLIEQIGQGGMGQVWLAEHTLLKRRAAIKVLRPSVSESDEIVTRFFNEARATTAISDPGIVQIFDFGHHTDGSAYIVMELLDGETLDKRLDRVGTLSVDDALRFMRQVASSLGAAHACQIVHRDLKPENIFLIRDNEVPGGERAKILDFGIAKLTQDPFAKKTQTAALIGTPMFMSPEQCRGAGHVDQRADIYSLGCVLFNLLVGHPPFDAAGMGEIIAKHLTEPTPRLSRFIKAPPGLEALLDRCMAKDPADRFTNGAELADAIEAFLVRARGSTPQIRPSTPQVRPSTPQVRPSTPQSRPSTPAADAWRLAPTAAEVPPTLHTLVPEERSRPKTTLSSAAQARETVAPPPAKLDKRIALAIGGVAALGLVGYLATRSGHDAPAVAAVAAVAPAAAPAITVQPVPVAAPDPAEVAKVQIVTTLAAFTRWSVHHAADACPSANELAKLVSGGLVDPWGHALVITCTDQPSDQIVGVISWGPDGLAGTRDDLESWQLGPQVTDVVRGARWRPVAPIAPHVAPIAPRVAQPITPKVTAPPRAPAKQPTFRGTALGNDGIPTTR